MNLSIVIPAFNEDSNIIKILERINRLEIDSKEILVIVDSKDDTTFKVEEVISKFNARLLIQNLGKGPANAIQYGLLNSTGNCIVVMMADGSDNPEQIPEMLSLIDRGVAVVAASRYMPGGQQVGGPRIKKFLSRLAGKILFYVAGVGTLDPTNSYKAYSREFLKSITIESKFGFEIGLELISKAHKRRLLIAEVPTIWVDRTEGESNFKMTKWIPKYLAWFMNCFSGRVG
jgi:dolichol-phosphate mannosyltransferase